MTEPSSPAPLSHNAQLALGHIRGRTRSGRFASGHYQMTDEQWTAAVAELEAHGDQVRWKFGTVGDDPRVNGGWVIDE
jgi:hypothetical protein